MPSPVMPNRPPLKRSKVNALGRQAASIGNRFESRWSVVRIFAPLLSFLILKNCTIERLSVVESGFAPYRAKISLSLSRRDHPPALVWTVKSGSRKAIGLPSPASHSANAQCVNTVCEVLNIDRRVLHGE